MKLSKYFDLDMLTVKFPPKGYNDFGDAHLDDYDLNSWLDKNIDKNAQIKYILEFVKNNPSSFTKKILKQPYLLVMPEPNTPLSASRIKTAQSCSWLYWCKYKLKLPDKSNEGAKRGSICHLVFEVLGVKGRKNILIKYLKQKMFLYTLHKKADNVSCC